MKKLIAGNWKMNLDRDGVNELVYDIMTTLQGPQLDGVGAKDFPNADFLIAPPYIYIDRCTKFFAGRDVAISAQDCAAHDNGAHTGDISARMLSEMGCTHVILGHSERRHNLGESSALIARKVDQAKTHGLNNPIICVGETEEERESGKAEEVVKAQLDDSIPESIGNLDFIVAYEPVWAIGTGKAATPDDVKAMHAFIREQLAARFEQGATTRILYGGSVKPENAADLLHLPNVDGALIGGASLKAESFLGIAAAV